MVGCIYLIINKLNLIKGIKPYFYIGSKKDFNKIKNYWGSSKKLSDDIKELGVENFNKIIIKKVEYSSHEELLNEEYLIQSKLNVIKSPLYYNKNYAIPKFFKKNEHTNNTVWVNNGTNNKRISKLNEIDFLKNGYNKGRIKFTLKNRIYINKNDEIKSIEKKDLNYFINSGWNLGRLIGNQTNKRAITKEGVNKYVFPNQLEKYISDGWKLGQKQNKK